MFGSIIVARRNDQPFVIAQLGQSLDGRIATVSGHSHYINGAAALEHLHRLRALVDAVVVGAKTVLADNPSLTVRRATGSNPARVIIDPRRRATENAKFFDDDGAGCVVIGPPRASDGDHVRTIVPVPDRPIEPQWIVGQLDALGYRRILVEGGTFTVSRFLQSGQIDRLHLLVGPIIIGSGPVGIELAEIETLESAIRPEVHMFPLAEGDVLFDCDLRNNAHPVA